MAFRWKYTLIHFPLIGCINTYGSSCTLVLTSASFPEKAIPYLTIFLIPAFSRFEEKRADRFQEMLEDEGFKTTRDAVNNVYYFIF